MMKTIYGPHNEAVIRGTLDIKNIEIVFMEKTLMSYGNIWFALEKHQIHPQTAGVRLPLI